MTKATATIEVLVPEENKEVIERAAQLLGLSVSEFASSRLVSIARQTLREHEIIRLTNRDRDVFLAMLAADEEPNAALAKAFRDVP